MASPGGNGSGWRGDKLAKGGRSLFFSFSLFLSLFFFLFSFSSFFWSARPSSLVGKVGTSNVMEVMDWGIGPLCLDARTRGAADTGRAAAAGAGNGSCRLPLPVQRSLCSRGSSAKMWRRWRRLPPDRRWCGPAIRGTQVSLTDMHVDGPRTAELPQALAVGGFHCESTR